MESLQKQNKNKIGLLPKNVTQTVMKLYFNFLYKISYKVHKPAPCFKLTKDARKSCNYKRRHQIRQRFAMTQGSPFENSVK